MQRIPNETKLFIFDIDGTLHTDGVLVSGALELLQRLRQENFQIRFMTNTTTKSQQMLLDQLNGLGIEANTEEILSAPEASRIFLKQEQQSSGRPLKIWAVVNDHIRADFDAFEHSSERPDFVVIGDIGKDWSIDLLNQIFSCLNRGAKLIALHKNKFWQTRQGLKVDIGLFIAGLEYVSSQSALIMGKPNITFFKQVLASAHCDASEAVLIGDDIDSDVGGAQRLDIFSVLVKTGKYRSEYHAESKIQPDSVIDSVADLAQYLA